MLIKVPIPYIQFYIEDLVRRVERILHELMINNGKTAATVFEVTPP